MYCPLSRFWFPWQLTSLFILLRYSTMAFFNIGGFWFVDGWTEAGDGDFTHTSCVFCAFTVRSRRSGTKWFGAQVPLEVCPDVDVHMIYMGTAWCEVRGLKVLFKMRSHVSIIPLTGGWMLMMGVPITIEAACMVQAEDKPPFLEQVWQASL